MIEGAICDVDGTILDSMPMWDNIGRIYLQQKGIEAEPNLNRVMFTMTMPEAADYLKQKYALPRSPEEIITEINGMIQKFYENKVPMKAGVYSLLLSLHARGIPITAASLSQRGMIEAAFYRLGIDRLFRRVFTSTEIGAGKDRPDIFYAAQTHMGTDISSTWVFEDGLYAMKTAKAAGFRICGVFDPSSISDQEEIQSVCDIYLPSYEGVLVSRFEGESEL